MQKMPFVSFIIPTLNADRYLKECLESINKQNYPKEKYEVLIIDGGSKDKTLTFAREFGFRVLKNTKVDQESGKALGIREAKGEIVVLMDADNVIVKRDWLKKMIVPIIENPKLFGVESYYFSNEGDNIFNKYCMAIHIADPFSRMLAAKLGVSHHKDYEELTIPTGQSYPLGANGFLWNRKVIDKVGLKGAMFEESNFSYYVMQAGYRSFARVPGYGIYHYHIDSFRDFIAKRLKIGNKFLNRKEEKKRTWLEGVAKGKFIFSLVYCATIVGPLVEGVYHFLKEKNSAWLIHPVMSFVSVTIYAFVFAKRLLNNN